MKTQLVFVILSFVFISVTTIFAQDTSMKLLGDFKEGWEKNWLERKFAGPPAAFEVVKEDTNLVLQVTTDRSGSGLWHPLNLRLTERARIAWKWKIDRALSDKTPEKEKIGDDYAARVYVIFQPHLVNWRTRAICYVWAAKEPVGSIYRSPYTNTVAIIVLQSGKTNKDKWVQEERDFANDYRKIFGEAPEMLTGVAILVDTDNTNQKAITWFDDIVLNLQKTEKDTVRRRDIRLRMNR